MTVSESVVTVTPSPNGLWHTVRLGEKVLAEVLDDPHRRGVKVTTFDAKGQPDLVLQHPFKVHPVRAAQLCLALGVPAEHATRFDVTAQRDQHGESAVLLLDCGDHVECLRDDAPALALLGVPEAFCKSRLEEYSLRLIGEGRKVVLCASAQEGGAEQ